MAYFSNGTEGMQWESRNCERCLFNKLEPIEETVCSIQLVHYTHNYEQHSNEGVKQVLSHLVPMENNRAVDCPVRLMMDRLIKERKDLYIKLPGVE